MSLRIVPGTANPLLAAAVARTLHTEPVTYELDRFPDGELRPVVDHLRGDDVYVIQPTGPPVSDHLVELLLLLDACRRGGAGRITAVLPYFIVMGKFAGPPGWPVTAWRSSARFPGDDEGPVLRGSRTLWAVLTFAGQ